MNYDYWEWEWPEHAMYTVFLTGCISKRLADWVDEEKCEDCWNLSHGGTCDDPCM